MQKFIKKIFLLGGIACTLTLTFCSAPKEKAIDYNDKNIITIDISEFDSDFNQFVEKVDYTILELNKNFPIANIDKLVQQDSLYYIKDKKGKAVFIYSQSGRFIKCISNHGKGPTHAGASVVCKLEALLTCAIHYTNF